LNLAQSPEHAAMQDTDTSMVSANTEDEEVELDQFSVTNMFVHETTDSLRLGQKMEERQVEDFEFKVPLPRIPRGI